MKVIRLDKGTALTVPPQLLPAPLGLATTKPAGSVSVNETVMGKALPFDARKFRFVLVLMGKTAAPKILEIDGGTNGTATTVMEALAVPPVPPLVEVTLDVILFFTPTVVAVTLTETTQVTPAASVAPVSEVKPVIPACPPWQELEVVTGTAVSIPAGNVSVNPTPVKGTVFGLPSVKVRLVVWPNAAVP